MISTGFQNPTNFAESTVWLSYVFQYVLGYDEIKSIIRETKRLQVLATDATGSIFTGWHVIKIFGADITWQAIENAVNGTIRLSLVDL